MAQATHIHPNLATNGNTVRYAVHFEFADRQVPDLNRVVDQLSVVKRLIGSEAILLCIFAPHRRGDAPVRGNRIIWRQYFELAR